MLAKRAALGLPGCNFEDREMNCTSKAIFLTSSIFCIPFKQHCSQISSFISSFSFSSSIDKDFISLLHFYAFLMTVNISFSKSFVKDLSFPQSFLNLIRFKRCFCCSHFNIFFISVSISVSHFFIFHFSNLLSFLFVSQWYNNGSWTKLFLEMNHVFVGWSVLPNLTQQSRMTQLF